MSGHGNILVPSLGPNLMSRTSCTTMDGQMWRSLTRFVKAPNLFGSSKPKLRTPRKVSQIFGLTRMMMAPVTWQLPRHGLGLGSQSLLNRSWLPKNVGLTPNLPATRPQLRSICPRAQRPHLLRPRNVRHVGKLRLKKRESLRSKTLTHKRRFVLSTPNGISSTLGAPGTDVVLIA